MPKVARATASSSYIVFASASVSTVSFQRPRSQAGVVMLMSAQPRTPGAATTRVPAPATRALPTPAWAGVNVQVEGAAFSVTAPMVVQLSRVLVANPEPFHISALTGTGNTRNSDPCALRRCRRPKRTPVAAPTALAVQGAQVDRPRRRGRGSRRAQPLRSRPRTPRRRPGRPRRALCGSGSRAPAARAS